MIEKPVTLKHYIKVYLSLQSTNVINCVPSIQLLSVVRVRRNNVPNLPEKLTDDGYRSLVTGQAGISYL